MFKAWVRSCALALSVVAAGAGTASAQGDFPNRAIKIVVPFAAGGGVDTVARLVGEEFKHSLGQVPVIDNQPGASGMRGAETVVRSTADGYTILLSSAGEIAVNPHLFKSMRYDPAKDLAPITLVVRVPNVLVVSSSSPLKSLDDVLAAARTDGKVTYSSSGLGNPQHLAGELINKKVSGTKLLHVPYKGASAQVQDVLSGSVTATFASYLAVGSFVQGGQLRAIAVTSAERIPSLPDVPAIAENAQLKGYDVTNWFGMFAPANTPAPIIDKLNKAIVAALANPDVARKLETLGSYPATMPPAEFGKFVAAESAKFKDIVSVAGITLQ